MTPTMIVNDGLHFSCRTGMERRRARTLLTKEPGTLAWLRAHVQPGDVVYDIGASVGCYTLYAARLVGDTGHVYAFEPNATALLRNIAANPDIRDRIVVVPVRLGRDVGDGVASIDTLYIPTPHLVKLDVDGDELRILEGMRGVLVDAPPRSLQVECVPKARAAIHDYLARYGYVKTDAHYTSWGQRQLSAGVPAADVLDNAIFQRVA